MNGRGRRSKGHAAERELGRLLGASLGLDIARNLEQSRDGGADLLGLPLVAIEVKRHETLALPAWWAQARGQARVDRIPVLAYRQSRQPWRFVIALVDLCGYGGSREYAWTGTLYVEGFVEWYTGTLHKRELV